MSGNQENQSPLLAEFKQSLKQAKIRASGYQMKERPDRTFSNLSKK
jgi:hypothetical protein